MKNSILISLAVLLASFGFAAEQSDSVLNRSIDGFSLCDAHGKRWSLSDVKDAEIVVVAFLGCDCPLARIYGNRLREIAKRYRRKQVAIVGVNANAQDSLRSIREFETEHVISFPILKDPDAAVVDQLGATRTPEVFLLQKSGGGWRTRYYGRIDDEYEIGKKRTATMTSDLANAIDDLLAGKPVQTPHQPAIGCLIGRPPKTEPRGGITWSKDVATIVSRKCAVCHQPGEAAPFTLTTYAQVKHWSAMIAEVVQTKRMPPWFADPQFGEFSNDCSLSDEEKTTLLSWIENGCPLGDAASEAIPLTPPASQGIAHPDRVLQVSNEPFEVPAQGDIEYQYFTIDPGFTEDTFIRAAEVRPGNRRVVHHALVSILRPDEPGQGVGDLGVLINYAPGMQPTRLPAGAAIRIPAGSKFLVQMHYTPVGSPQKDATTLRLQFEDSANVRRLVNGGAIANPLISIPAGAANHEQHAQIRFAEDRLLLSMSPHMHLRGKAFRFEAVFPDGKTETLLSTPNYDFNWQLRYLLKEPRLLPAGTTVRCVAVYDNSQGNFANPNPEIEVRWGERTNDEMLIGFFSTMPAR